MSVSTDCASAMASKPHTDTSTSKATVPISLRVRMDIEALSYWRMILSENRFSLFGIMRVVVICGGLRMTIWSARYPAKQAFHARSAFHSGVSRARAAAVAARSGGDDLADADHRRRHAAHRLRAFDRGMESGRRRAAAAERRRMAGRIREIPRDPAIPQTQPRHEPGAVQGDLFVGMDAPAAGARDRGGVPAAVSVFPGARLDSAAAATAAMDHLCRRRRARRGRLVDGGLGPRRQHADQGLAIPAGVSYDAGLRGLCRHRLDRAADRAADAGRGAQAPAPRRLGDRRAAARADLSRRARGRARWRIEVQYLAADRRRDHAAARPAAIHQTTLAQSVREYTDGSDQSPHARRCDFVFGSVAWL